MQVVGIIEEGFGEPLSSLHVSERYGLNRIPSKPWDGSLQDRLQKRSVILRRLMYAEVLEGSKQTVALDRFEVERTTATR